MHNKFILNSIEKEKNGTDYIYRESDKILLKSMFEDINKKLGTDICYLAEMDAYNISGSGKIIAKYINEFESESVRAYLIPQLVADKITDCDKIILQLYLHFKASDEYIIGANNTSSAHIYVRYDNAIKILKPKRLVKDLIQLAHSPRDAFYLPFTMRMLASWKIPELKEILISYSFGNITDKDIGVNAGDILCPPLSYINRELRFTAIYGLKYYPSDDVRELIKSFTFESDKDIRALAKKTLKAITK